MWLMRGAARASGPVLAGLALLALAAVAAAQPPATIRVASAGTGMEVWLDGRRVGSAESGRDLVVSGLPAGTYRLQARGAGRIWERTVEVAPGGVATVAVDLTVSRSTARPTLAAEVLAHVDASYVDPPNLPVMRLAAFRGLEKAVGADAFQVTEGAEGAGISYRLPGEPPTRLIFTGGPGRDAILGDLGAGYRLAALVAPATDPARLEHAMLREAIRSLDPHSTFLDPEAAREFDAQTSGSFGGVGIEVSEKDGDFVVVAPIEGTPAWRAGIQPGDRIVGIEGTPLRDLSLAEAIRRMRGPKGSKVTFTLEREGSPAPIELTLVREIIQVQSVSTRELAPDIGYVRIRQFQTRTARDVEIGLAQFDKNGQVAGIVLDLRNNPGGLLSAAVEVAERFLPGGKLVVYTEGRVRSHNTRFVARGRRSRTDIPLAVLVNQGSASASEIVAAAVQDHGRGAILGQQSFGKGSVQTIIALPGGAALRLTTARYFTPKGRSINGSGVTPDVVVEAGPADAPDAPASAPRTDAERQRTDTQLQRAVTHLREVIAASPRREPADAPSAGGARAPVFSTGQEHPSR
jgi:carboxyl-terminal processing protease